MARRWKRSEKLAAWAIGVPAITALVVSLTSHRTAPPTLVQVETNEGVVNLGTVNNYFEGTPVPTGPSVRTETCPTLPTHEEPVGADLTINLYARQYQDGACWATDITPGLAPATIEYEIAYKNISHEVQENVVVAVKLPAGLTIVPNTTYIANSTYPQGKAVADGVSTSGLMIGSYSPEANAYVAFEAVTKRVDELECGENLLRTMATVQPEEMNWYYNTADVRLTRHC